MQATITVQLEARDAETILDLVKIIEMTAAYMTDNVVVTSQVEVVK